MALGYVYASGASGASRGASGDTMGEQAATRAAASASAARAGVLEYGMRLPRSGDGEASGRETWDGKRIAERGSPREHESVAREYRIHVPARRRRRDPSPADRKTSGSPCAASHA